MIFLLSRLAKSLQAQESTTGEPLRVVTKEFPPLVFVDDDGSTVRGYSIDLWEEVAQRMDLEFEYVVVESVTDQIEMVVAGDADVAIAGISITSAREGIIDFSFPYLNSGLQILTLKERSLGMGRILSTFLSPALLEIIGVFFLLLLIAAHLIWFVERRSNPEFPQGYLKGIWESIWWAAVTVTTVGYGDKTPRGMFGRLLGLVWMFLGLFLVANFTAGVTTMLSVQQLQNSIHDISDLQGKRVATVEGTTADEYLTSIGIRPIRMPTIDAAYDRLLEKDVQAVVFDAPVLLHYANTDGLGKVQMVGLIFNEEDYGIALAEGSLYREEINRILLEIQEDGTRQEIYARWFGQ